MSKKKKKQKRLDAGFEQHLPKRAKRRARGKRRGFATEEKQSRYIIWDNRCAYCNTNKEKMTADHFVPLHAAGKAADRIDNIIPACFRCNNQKGCKNAWEWYSKQSFFDLQRWNKILDNVRRIDGF